MVLFIVAEMHWRIFQLKVKSTSLYAYTEENVFVEMTPGFEQERIQLLLEVKKSLYGLVQRPPIWWENIDPTLAENRLVSLKSDACIYIYNHNDAVVILTLHANDLLEVGGIIQVTEIIKMNLTNIFRK